MEEAFGRDFYFTAAAGGLASGDFNRGTDLAGLPRADFVSPGTGRFRRPPVHVP